MDRAYKRVGENNPVYKNTKISGERLRIARGSIPQSVVANDMGFAQYQTISNYETENATPSFATLLKLCNYYNCDMDFLLGNIDTPHRAAADIKEQTGLSVEAAEKMLKWSKSGSSAFVTDFISKMIENDDLIFSLLRAGNEYTRIQDKEQLNEGTDIIDEGGGVLLMGKNDALHFLSFEIQRLLTDFVYSYFGVGENEEDEK